MKTFDDWIAAYDGSGGYVKVVRRAAWDAGVATERERCAGWVRKMLAGWDDVLAVAVEQRDDEVGKRCRDRIESLRACLAVIERGTT